MLKDAKAMKKVETAAGEALCRMLENISILQIDGTAEEVGSNDWKPDWIVRVRVHGRPHHLICEYKANGQPRYARSAMLELKHYIAHRDLQATPILMAPYLSPAVRQMCNENGVGYFDLEGNARIIFDSVFIERTVPDKPATAQRELKSLFRPKSAQVLRAMLREPGRAWRVSDLSEAARVSLGHVSNVRTGLLDREWARISDDGLILSDPDTLLDAWRDSYGPPAGERLGFYTTLHGSAFENAARGALEAGHAAFASFSAAQWLAPYGRTGSHYFYANEDGLRKLQHALALAPATTGANVAVVVPKDVELIDDTVEPAPGAICTNPVQTYLDLTIAGERGAEAAEYLRKERLSWPK